ncbi:MAG: sulfatase-like hydrolase/transferase, partial [Armatimonadetes bacterium]|nr:sulfatase-like hydrolase/transferase [Armatimonadota bacterium]
YFGPFVDREGHTLPGLEDTREGEYMTDRLTDEAIGLIRGHGGDRSEDRPFFLHLSHYAVHTPIVSPPDLVARYEAKATQLGLDTLNPLVRGGLMPALHQLGQHMERRVFQSHTGYAAMIHNLDWNVGRLMQTLRETGQDENTLVVFVSDNGGLSVGVEGSVTCNLPYREGKGWMEEGGNRVPFLMRWPAGIPGGRLTDTPIWQCDLYPTFLQAAGLPLEPGHHCEGEGLMGLLTGVAGPRPSPALGTPRDSVPAYERTLCWHYPNYPNQGTGPAGAIRQGDYKLIERFETGELSLHNLAEDITETFDLAAEQPERVRAMHERLVAWREEVGAVMPTPNPYYEDIVAGRLPRPDGLGNFPAGTVLPQ